RTEDDKYGLGLSLFDLGRAAANQYDMLDIARPEMERLSKETGLSVIIGLRNHHHLVVLETVDSAQHIAVTVKTGLRLPAVGSSSGRVMLAFSNPTLVDQVLQNPSDHTIGQVRFTSTSLKERLSMIREKGYEYAEGESQYGVSAIAAPIVNSNNELLAVMSIVGTHSQVGSPPHDYLIQELLRSTNIVSSTNKK